VERAAVVGTTLLPIPAHIQQPTKAINIVIVVIIIITIMSKRHSSSTWARKQHSRMLKLHINMCLGITPAHRLRRRLTTVSEG
jgi:hypothetical protein